MTAKLTSRGQRDHMVVFREHELPLVDAGVFPANVVDIRPAEHTPYDLITDRCKQLQNGPKAHDNWFQAHPYHLSRDALLRTLQRALSRL